METLEERLEAVVVELTFAGEWTDRYRLLIQWGEEAEGLPEAERLSQDEVTGCSSPLWLRVRRTGGRLDVKGYSPGLLASAMVALVVRLFDGLEDAQGSVSEILDRLDLKRHLSPTRAMVLERMVDRALSCPPETL